MLKREQRDKWAEELESGRWKQGRAHLRNRDAYCCMGVLCAAVLGRNPKHQSGIYEVIKENMDYPHESLTYKQMIHFADLNDCKRLPFPEIAKHVRALPASDEEP